MVTYDPSASLESNYIQNETHPLTDSVGVIFNHGAFYEKDLKIELSYNGIHWKTASLTSDLLLSPLSVELSYNASSSAYNYVVVLGNYKHLRVTYRAVGAPVEPGVLTMINDLVVDKKNVTQWIMVPGANKHIQVDKTWVGLGEAEAVSQGLNGVRLALERLQSIDNKATLAQVNAIEARQNAVEIHSTETRTIADLVSSEFDTLRDSYYSLTDYFINGGQSNTQYSDGYAYLSEGMRTDHIINHGLDSENLTVTVWVMDALGEYIRPDNDVQAKITLVDGNIATIDTSAPTKVIAVFRLNTNGYMQEAVSAVYVNLNHNLDAEYITANVWKRTANGLEYVYMNDNTTLTERSNNAMEFNSLEQETYYFTLAPAGPGTFVHATELTSLDVITHYFKTNYLDIALWSKPDPLADYVLVDQSLTIKSLSTLAVEGLPAIYKLVITPVGVEVVDFSQTMINDMQNITTSFNEMATRVTALENALAEFGAGNIYEYDSDTTAPALLHQVTHNLGSLFVRTEVWVLQENGLYHVEFASIVPLDANTILITLTSPGVIHAKITI